MKTIILVVTALILVDILVDVIIIKRMGYSPTAVLRSAWARVKSWFRRAPEPVPATYTDASYYDDVECNCEACRGCDD